MKYLIIVLVIIHGLLHVIGFVNAMGFVHLPLKREILKFEGIVWLVAASSLLLAVALYQLDIKQGWFYAIAGVMISQSLIILNWHDAKAGSFINLIILLISIIAVAEWRFENKFKNDVTTFLSTESQNGFILTSQAIQNLPEPVQRYIIFSGALNKPVPKNFKIGFAGKIRQNEQSDWLPFTSQQFNSIDNPARFFFMKATSKGIPINGYHVFENGKANMKIRLLSLFTIQKQSGSEMDKSETVTWFNDLCLFAPGALVDKRIKWQPIDSTSCRALFINQENTISATLIFNKQGALINFISDDRYRIVSGSDIQKLRFLTPVKEYIKLNDLTIPGYAEAEWQLPDRVLCYGQFRIEEIEYNISQ